MQIRKLFLSGAMASLILACCFRSSGAPSFAQTDLSSHYKFVTLDYPNAPITYPLGINAKEEIAGYYLDANFAPHGFVYKHGKFTAIEYPGAISTVAGGINDYGDVVGVYLDLQGFEHGYLMTMPRGCDDDWENHLFHCQPTFESIDVPGAAQTRDIPFEFGPGLGTGLAGLNNRDEVAGIYATDGLYSNGFIHSREGFRPVDHPSASHGPGLGTRLFGINNHGVAVGDYIVQSSPQAPPINYGFLLEGERYIPIFVPGSELGGFGTQVNGINDFNTAVGIFSDKFGRGHGFLWVQRQAFALDYPGAGFTEAHTVNNRGMITGSYAVDPSGLTIHGFVATPKW